jgi:hypothetical protein
MLAATPPTVKPEQAEFRVVTRPSRCHGMQVNFAIRASH